MKKHLLDLPEILFLILSATIPIQLGKHFWPNFSQVLGLRVDFLAPTIFFTDIIIILFIFSCAIRIFLKRKFLPKTLIFSLILFLLGIIISTVFSKNPTLSFWFLVKFFEFSALAFACSTLSFNKINLRLALIFVIVGVFSVVLATLQFWQQGSVGFWAIGERSFNLLTPGIAKVDFAGVAILRPYSTFPHPNVLAGFLVVSILIIFFSNLPKFVKFIILPILTFGLFLTFSRSGWLGLIFAAFFLSLIKFNWTKIAKASLVILLGLALILAISPQNPVALRFWQVGKSDIHSLTLRKKLATAGTKMFFTNPITGVGPGNFIPNLPKFWDYQENIRFLQPVHNVPLLVLAETGLVGTAGFAFLLWRTFANLLKNFKKIPNFIIGFWAVIFLISQFDHYFWTLQQGQILFWLILGLTWARFGNERVN